MRTGDSGALLEEWRSAVDLVDGDDWHEPGTAVVIAVPLVASAAVAFGVLPAAIGLGLLPARIDQLATGLLGLAVGIGGVLGALRLAAVVRDTGYRLLATRPTRLDATTAD